MALVQIVPGLFPTVDGIGDYALQLGRQLESSYGVESRFMVYDSSWGCAAGSTIVGVKLSGKHYDGFCRTLALLEQTQGDQILLHFSPYGYAKRGCPFWLVRDLERWDRKHPGRLNIAFHELDNKSSNPLRSAFWLYRTQRSLVARVGKLGKFRYTNTDLFRRDLEGWKCGSIEVIPNFSTMGEARSLPTWDMRERDLVIFGRSAQRKNAYGRGVEALLHICKALKVTRVVDIGEPIDIDLKEIFVERCGVLPPDQVANRMSRAIGSFISYPVPLLTKSSAYAVSCAYGAIPFIHDPNGRQLLCPGLVEGNDFINVSGNDSSLSWSELEQASKRVYEGYRKRSLPVAARRIAEAIGST